MIEPIFAALRANRKREAGQLARALVLASPRDGRVHWAYAETLKAQYLLDLAEMEFRRARELGENSAPVETGLGFCLVQLGRIEEATDAFISAHRLDKQYVQALIGMVKCCELIGQTSDALGYIDRAEKIAPGTDNLAVLKANLLEGMGKRNETFEVLANANATPLTLLARGRIAEKMGLYDCAWKDWSAGNELARSAGFVYDEIKTNTFLDALKRFCTRTQMDLLEPCGAPEERGGECQPLFICGFPRSGTTMIEQSLSMHPKIVAGDELPFIGQIAEQSQHIIGSRLPYPFCLSELVLAEKHVYRHLMREFYLEGASKRGLFDYNSGYFTDKMCINELHIPLIHLLFPSAPILYVRRHPLDIIVSNFSHYLPHGNAQSFDVVSCAKYYVAVDAIVEHYKRKIGDRIRFLEIKYEHFISDPTYQLMTLSSWLDIKYNDACVNFDRNPRHARTASYAQVKKPLYSSSVGRYKAFMDRGLIPSEVIEMVRPICEREGYEV